MAWTYVNPVVIGFPTKKDDFNAAFDNTIYGRDSVGDFTTLYLGTGVNGSVSAPAITWRDDTDSGLYRIGANNLAMTIGGSKLWDWALNSSQSVVALADTAITPFFINSRTTVTSSASRTSYSVWGRAEGYANASQTNSGIIYGGYFQSLRNYTAPISGNDNGTVNQLTGGYFGFGHSSYDAAMSGTTSVASGIWIQPLCSYGTITTSYDIFISDYTGSGAVTNKWGLYVNGSAKKNYIQGATFIGSATDNASGAMLQVTGAASNTNPAATFTNTVNNDTTIGLALVNAGTAGTSWRSRLTFRSAATTDVIGIAAYYGAASQYGIIFQTTSTTFAGRSILAHDGSFVAGATSVDGTGALLQSGTGVTVESATDLTGVVGRLGITGVTNTTANSTGVGTILFKGTTSRDSAGFWKIWLGVNSYYVPIFSAITG